MVLLYTSILIPKLREMGIASTYYCSKSKPFMELSFNRKKPIAFQEQTSNGDFIKFSEEW